MADRDLELILKDPISREFPDVGLRPLPGRAILWQMKQESIGSLILPEQEALNSDVSILAHEHQGLPEGAFIACRGYRGATFVHDSGDVFRVYGVQEPLDHVLMMVWDDGWKPLEPWSIIELEKTESVIEHNVRNPNIGKILMTTDKDYKSGDRVACEIGNGLYVPALGDGVIITKEIHAPIN